MQDGLVVGNGIAWSADDRRCISPTPSPKRCGATTSTSPPARSPIAGPSSRPPISAAGIDGATVDADGCYWAALFRGGAVAQFDPDGRLVRHIRLPVSNPTMCAFGGPDLDVLYVTSASRFLDDAQRRAQPLAGHLFAIAWPRRPRPSRAGVRRMTSVAARRACACSNAPASSPARTAPTCSLFWARRPSRSSGRRRATGCAARAAMRRWPPPAWAARSCPATPASGRWR